MIIELNIKNFALIKNLNISFKEGFNVIMGETGSGKSNIIDAISIMFGARASKDKIRRNTDQAQLSMTLDIGDHGPMIDYLKSNNLYVEDENLVISRIIHQKTSTISKVNDINVTSKTLKDLSSFIIDIYGQFENILILSKNEQLKFLDRIGGKAYQDLLSTYKSAYLSYKKNLEAYKNFVKNDEEINRNAEFLEYQIKDIESSNILNLDEESILDNLALVENSHFIKARIQEAIELFDKDDNGILKNISSVESSLEDIEGYQDKIVSLKERVESAYLDLDDVKYELNTLLSDIDFDDQDYRDLLKKRDLIFDMKRKYGNEIEAINKFYEDSLKELDLIKNYEENLQKLREDLKKSQDKALELAKLISKKRKENAKVLELRIIEELESLDMVDTSFKIDFDQVDMGPKGIDLVNFMVSFNKNEDLKELSNVASGGEISRFMLAIKSIEAHIDKTPILIFDEIDTGISGNAGQVVGQKLKDLSKSRILISVSHLPQIIAIAKHQFLVSKESDGQEVASILSELNYEDRVIELAKVIQGDQYSKSTLDTARTMIDENMEDRV